MLLIFFGLFLSHLSSIPSPGIEHATVVSKEAAPSQETMNNKNLGELLKAFANIIEGKPGYWTVEFHGRIIMVITDESHNRMRIITPVVQASELKDGEHQRLLEANFHSALDARYALFKDVLWSVYIHPLAELSGTQFLDGLKQVKQLADNYGTSYSSTDVVLNKD